MGNVFKNGNRLKQKNKLNKTSVVNSKEIVVSFPHMGNYYTVIYFLLSSILPNARIQIPKKITKKTMELGEKYSPEFVCTPFKYNLGNYIESLENGANVLMQAGGGCRFGYYAELQEQILKDLGYDFLFITILDAKGVNIFNIYNKFKYINPKLTFIKFVYYFTISVEMVKFLDKFEGYIRKNLCFEINKNDFDKIHKEFLKKIMKIKKGKQLKSVYFKYMKMLKKVPLNKGSGKLKVGIVGELYDIMEPFTNFFIEKNLAKMNIEVERNITVTYLLFEKGKEEKRLLKDSKKYIKYALGADGTESVAHSIQMCDLGYDGIIHVKPFGCTPEINAIPILQKISQDYNIPIVYFTFDMQTSETGIKTRLEAFYDMLMMKKEAKRSV